MKNYCSGSAYPDFNYDKITDISPADLRMMGVKAVAVDLDNTTVSFGSYFLEDGVKEWVTRISDAGIKVMVITNTLAFRAFVITRQMGNLPFIPLALKPNTRALKIASRMLGVDVSEIAMIGDQLFTDVLSANRIGAVSVKVEAIGNESLFGEYFNKKRMLEQSYIESIESSQGLVPMETI